MTTNPKNGPALLGAATSSGSGVEIPTTLVLLCRDLERSVPRFELGEVSSWLSEHYEDVEVRRIGDLCRNPAAVRDSLRQTPARRLVLGLCARDYPDIEVQAHTRKAGLDPLGIHAVNLGICREAATRRALVTARARLLLSAAVERVRAFPGSQPENMKAVFPSSQQKISRRALFTLPPVSYVATPTINRRRCTASEGCDQCVGVCPYKALERDGDTIAVHRAQCESCGACVAVCPQRAVEFPGWSPEELEGQLTGLLETVSDLESRQVAFVCKNAVKQAGPDWLPVQAPCMSMVTADVILQALARGADAVAVYSCGEDCPTGQSRVFQGRVDYCRQLLSLLGGPSEAARVRFLGPNDTASARAARDAPARTPPLKQPSNGSTRLFGIGVAADAVRALAGQYGADDLAVVHRHSPLGRVRIDEESCTGCQTCAGGCPTNALSVVNQEERVTLTFDAAFCTACGQCERLCPERSAGAIMFDRATDLAQLSQGPQVVFEGELAMCERCGSPVATRRMLERIATLLGDEFSPQHMGRLCMDCRGF